MDYIVILSPKAVGDLEAIVRYIAMNNPAAARKGWAKSAQQN
jgi:toxin ParE1/3/4